MAAPLHMLLLLSQDDLVLWMNALARLEHAGTGRQTPSGLCAWGERTPAELVVHRSARGNDMGSSGAARGAIAAPVVELHFDLHPWECWRYGSLIGRGCFRATLSRDTSQICSRSYSTYPTSLLTFHTHPSSEL
jgi:hypothetical protein